MNYYQFHISDFASHTSHLTLEEEAVYRRLLDYYYDTESPIPVKTQPVIRRLRLGSESVIFDAILSEFFVKMADGWHNLRADFEINDYHKKGDTARENSKKGGRPKKNRGLETQSVIAGFQNETQPKANQEPVTINHKQVTDGNVKPLRVIPGCPIQQITELYNSTANHLPKARVVTDAIKRSISTRWKENPKFQTLEFWRHLFDYCEANEFLSGRSQSRNGGTPFRASLDWIVRPSNFAKVINSNYEQSRT